MTPETATGWLEQTAKNSGLTFTPAALTAAAEQLVASVERDASGQFAYTNEGYASAYRIEKGEAVEIPIGEHVAGIIRRNAKAVAPAQVPSPVAASGSPAPALARPKAGAAVSDFGRAFAAMQDAATIREAETWPNPFIAGPNFNRARQQVLINKNPARAAQFKAQAGA